MERATVVVAGCGSAGALLALLLARAGVDVLVLEKPADFLRDFRGDTIHPATLRILDEAGLGEAFAQVPQQRTEQVAVTTDEGTFPVADFRRLPGRHRYLAFVPQWDFLDFLVEHASAYPSFTMLRGPRSSGCCGRGAGSGACATATPRASCTRCTPTSSSPPTDAPAPYAGRRDCRCADLWFRLSRRREDSATGTFGRVSRGALLVLIDRGGHWQVAYVVGKGEADRLRGAGLDAFRSAVALVPALADRVGEVRSWEDVKLLDVRVDRLRRWWAPGVLCIGDAAHAMSPVGGVGINLAIQDAVAAANRLAVPLRDGRVRARHLAAVQARRWVPTVLTQAVQRVVQRGFLAPVTAGRGGGTPPPVRVLARVPALRALPAYAVGIGVLPEHVAPHLRPAHDLT